MIDTNPDKSSISPQRKKERESLKTNIYDLVHSEELELLYKKNTHLLSRLSKTGRENTQLHTKLSFLKKEKSYLGDRNAILKNKYLGLKEKISLFARQHRDFNQQSQNLKKELQKIQNIQTKKVSENTKNKKQEIKILQKKEEVYKSQIKNLQNLSKKQQEEYQLSKKEWVQKNQTTEEKLKQLSQALAKEVEQNQAAKLPPSQKWKAINQDLNKKSKALVKELKQANKAYQLILKEKQAIALQAGNFKNEITETANLLALERQKTEELHIQNSQLETNYQALLQKTKEDLEDSYEKKSEGFKNQIKGKEKELDLIKKNLRTANKSISVFKKQESKCQQWEEDLKQREQRLKQEIQKRKAEKQQIESLKKNQENLLNYKDQTFLLARQKEQQKADFTRQIHAFSEERDSLKFQCENLKKVLSAGHLGFDQAMLSFRRKYIKLYQQEKLLKDTVEKQKTKIQNLETHREESKNRFLQEKSQMEEKIKREKDMSLSQISGELKAVKEHNQDLESQILNLKQKKQTLFLIEKQKMQEEMKNLKWNQEKTLSHKEEQWTKEMESLKLRHENQLKNSEAAWKKKLQHIRIEMENEFLIEKKRYDVFKDKKTKEEQELENNLHSLQTKNQELLSTKTVLEKSLKEAKQSLNQHLKDNTVLENQTERLKHLWQDMQKQNEIKNQQIQSLQSLNRGLSLSFHQSEKKKTAAPPSPAAKEEKPVFTKPISSEKEDLREKETLNHILAEIHFD